nr:hypothetical protein [Xanthomonas vasicola]
MERHYFADMEACGGVVLAHLPLQHCGVLGLLRVLQAHLACAGGQGVDCLHARWRQLARACLTA